MVKNYFKKKLRCGAKTLICCCFWLSYVVFVSSAWKNVTTTYTVTRFLFSVSTACSEKRVTNRQLFVPVLWSVIPGTLHVHHHGQAEAQEAEDVDDHEDGETNFAQPLSHCRPVHPNGRWLAGLPPDRLWALGWNNSIGHHTVVPSPQLKQQNSTSYCRPFTTTETTAFDIILSSLHHNWNNRIRHHTVVPSPQLKQQNSTSYCRPFTTAETTEFDIILSSLHHSWNNSTGHQTAVPPTSSCHPFIPAETTALDIILSSLHPCHSKTVLVTQRQVK